MNKIREYSVILKNGEELKRILTKYRINNAAGIDSYMDKAYSKVLEDILLHKTNIAKIDEYTDELCYGIKS